MLPFDSRRFNNIAAYYANAGSGPVLAYVGSAGGGTNATTTSTWATANIGTASGFTTRRIIFVVMSNGTLPGALNSMSMLINGTISATQHIDGRDGNPGPGAIIFSADIPTGTTASVVLTATSNFGSAPVMVVYSVDDALLSSTTPSTASGTVNSGTSITSSSYTENAGGFTIAAIGSTGAAGGSGYILTGFTTNAFGASGNAQGSFSLSPTTGSTLTRTITWTTSASFTGFAVASWR